MKQALYPALTCLTIALTACSTEQTKPTPEDTSSAENESTTLASEESNTEESTRAAATREFRFLYAGAISELPPGTEVSVWLPIATDTHDQQILDREVNVPGEFTINQEEKFGNTILYFIAEANKQGEVPFEVIYQISRKEALAANGETASAEQNALFTQPTSFVPTDQNLSADVLGEISLAEQRMTAGRQIYDAVNNHMKYDKPAGQDWGRGDSVWACGNGFGNCTDFHSLFISVCREQHIPARFEIGFPLPTKRGQGAVDGYHCWAKFVADDQWVPVDISEADKDPDMNEYYYGNLTENRVTFTIGRELDLTPTQQAGPVNFLVYPYAEIDGKAHTPFRKSFEYEDIQ